MGLCSLCLQPRASVPWLAGACMPYRTMWPCPLAVAAELPLGGGLYRCVTLGPGCISPGLQDRCVCDPKFGDSLSWVPPPPPFPPSHSPPHPPWHSLCCPHRCPPPAVQHCRGDRLSEWADLGSSAGPVEVLASHAQDSIVFLNRGGGIIIASSYYFTGEDQDTGAWGVS